MAIIKRGILGGFSKKIGNVVGSSWKGIAVMKSLPLSVANPKTASQTAQRTRFKAVGQFASVILVSCIKPLRDRFATEQSGYNTFVSKNIDTFVGATLQTPQDLSISEGNLTPVETLTVAGTVSTNVIRFGWDDNSAVGNASTDDRFFVVVYNKTQDWVEGFNTGRLRESLQCDVNLSKDIDAGDDVHVWASFRKVDGTIVSDTAYKYEVMP